MELRLHKVLGNMTEKEKASKLSKLLEDVEQHVARCDELDPWGGIEAREAFLEACLCGTALIVRLVQTDPDMVGEFRRLKALPQIDADDLSALASPVADADSKRSAQIWGQALELTRARAESQRDLGDAQGLAEEQGCYGAAKFCASLAGEAKVPPGTAGAGWSKEQDKRIEFKEASQKLAGLLLYDLLDVLAEYEPEEYASLRLQVISSYLKELRVEFLWDGHVRGPCRTDSIPAQCKFENLPGGLTGQLAVVHGGRQHELTFSTDKAGQLECRINNTGTRNYRALLDGIWSVPAGKLRSHPQDGSAVWAFMEHECIQNLEAYASLITDLLKPLSAIAGYGDCARAIRALLRKGRGRWTQMSHVEWSYLDELDKLVAELDGKTKPYQSD
jgi:hypothetical protein